MASLEEQLAEALEDRRRLLDYALRLATGDAKPPASPSPARVDWPPNSLESSGGDLVCGRRCAALKIHVQSLE